MSCVDQQDKGFKVLVLTYQVCINKKTVLKLRCSCFMLIKKKEVLCFGGSVAEWLERWT